MFVVMLGDMVTCAKSVVMSGDVGQVLSLLLWLVMW